LRGSITQVEAALEVRTPAAGGQFRMKVADRIYGSRPDAAAALSSALLRHLTEPQTRYMASRDLGTVATLEDLPVHASTLRSPDGPIIAASIAGLSKAAITISRDDLTSPGHGIITRLENRVTGLDKTLAELKAHQQGTAEELTRAQAAVGTPFKHAQALQTARADRDMVTRQISANAEASTGHAGAALPAQVDIADRLAVDVNGRLTAMEEREFPARWAALSGRSGPSTGASQSRTAVTAAEPEAKEAAELEARRRETVRREDDARRREQGRGPHM